MVDNYKTIIIIYLNNKDISETRRKKGTLKIIVLVPLILNHN